jgi:membrane carboxypeptidase/penicillin-binding protein PbpC
MPSPQSLVLRAVLAAGIGVLADPGRGSVRWFVDGRAHIGARWALQPGRHRIRAVDAAGRAVEVGVAVE